MASGDERWADLRLDAQTGMFRMPDAELRLFVAYLELRGVRCRSSEPGALALRACSRSSHEVPRARSWS